MMSVHWTCWLGTVVGAGFLGWGIKGLVLGTVMDDKRREVERLTGKVTMLTKLANQPPEVRTVEKRVEVPVERVVIKQVEVPVEKIIEKRVEVPIERTVEKFVDRPVDNPEHLSRIKTLEGEVAVILRLLGQIVQLQTASAQAENRGSEGRVVVPIDAPEQLDRIKALEGEVAVIDDLRVQIAELQAASVHVGQKVAEKSIEPVTEKNGARPVDSPEPLARITALEADVAEITELRAQIAGLQHALGQVGGKADEKQGEPPVEKSEAVPVDHSEHLARIKALEGEVAEIAQLRTKIVELWESSVQAVEKVVESQSDIPAEKKVAQNMGVLVELLSEHKGDLDHAPAAKLLDRGRVVEESPDDLKDIRGVGPALERFLHKRGVVSFRQVATWKQADIDKFEFLLPNFSGRIQRENWVRSAQVEHYKKYNQWLGEGEPAAESLDRSAQIPQLQARSSQPGERVVEPRIEALTEKHGETLIGQVSHGGMTPSHADEQPGEGRVVEESPDDLKDIRGVGPALERFLHKRGVVSFRQVATWKQADIDKFEFLLPNFSGRIQRENWVRSAQVEHYKKYNQWLGNGEPPSESLNLPAPIAELPTEFVQDEGKFVEMRVESPAEQDVMRIGDVPGEALSEPAGDLGDSGTSEGLEEPQAVGESSDDLKQIRGVGPALERFLHKRGVFWFSQVATWSQEDIDKFEFLLPNFGGRIQREKWVHSAQVEYYRKYKQWLGDGEPPGTTPEMH